MDGRQSHCRIVLQKSILLSKSHRDALITHARENFPNESCALLFGTEKGGAFRVEEVFLTENSEQSEANFTISNDELLRGYTEAERIGLDVVGIFHSHPHSDATPSATDRKFMEINPVVWVIFSNKLEEFKAYILETGRSPDPVRLL